MKKIFALSALLLLAGCAHNIKITPQGVTPPTTAKSKTPVGYYIPADVKKLKVTTPGGGGDKVSYELTNDMEFGFYNTLSNAYETVKVLDGSHEAAQIKSQGLSLVFEPKFGSTSSGSSLMTWPADNFTISIICKAYNSSGVLVFDKTLTGSGQVASSEALKNFSAAANKAADDVLRQLKHEIETNPALK